ncbi:ragulator complex protein LAMTOR4 homolog [Clytia hemisphaerica]|uniref:Late endosomal/lysosomal adaptor and MAPK and MTOR activator 4 n=1 Tax=Clytia hemisphaerica TaxID=252671 RepID=A0A7M5X3Z6_9CNID
MSSSLLMGIDRIPDQTGYLVVNHEGAVLSSAGELENDEKTASTITQVVKHSAHLPLSTDPAETFKRISLTYDNFALLVTVSNQRIFVVKRPSSSSAPSE